MARTLNRTAGLSVRASRDVQHDDMELLRGARIIQTLRPPRQGHRESRACSEGGVPAKGATQGDADGNGKPSDDNVSSTPRRDNGA